MLVSDTSRSSTFPSVTPATSVSLHSKAKAATATLPSGRISVLRTGEQTPLPSDPTSSQGGSQKRKRDTICAVPDAVEPTGAHLEDPRVAGNMRKRAVSQLVLPQAPPDPPPQIQVQAPLAVPALVSVPAMPAPSPVFRHMRYEARCLQQIVSGLYLAFSDDETTFRGDPTGQKGPRLEDSEREELRTSDGQEFTHIIELFHRADRRPVDGAPPQEDTSYSVDKYTRTQRLRIALPSTSYAFAPFGSHLYERRLLGRGKRLTDDDLDAEGREAYFLELDAWEEAGIPTLTLAQLRAAHGFLRSSGFHVSSSSRSSSEGVARGVGPQGGVRVLITTPRDDRTDALCIMATFLATELGRKVSDVLKWLNERKKCLRVWQNVISRQWEKEVGNRLV